MSAFETITYLWLLPAIGVFMLIRLIIHADDKRIRDCYSWVIGLIITISIVYPFGMMFLMWFAVDEWKKSRAG